MRNSLTRYLRVLGVEVHSFGSAEDFLAQVSGLVPGSLVVDMELPGATGLDLLNHMARSGLNWPAVVISGSHEGYEEAVTQVIGPGRYLRKPFDPAALLQILSLSA